MCYEARGKFTEGAGEWPFLSQSQPSSAIQTETVQALESMGHHWGILDSIPCKHSSSVMVDLNNNYYYY